MSTRVDTASLIPGALVCGHRGLGVLGSTILLTTGDGDHGPGLLYNDVQAGDEGKEFRAFVAEPPKGLTLYEDGSFSYTGEPTSFEYRLFVDGVPIGTTTATLATKSNAVLLSGTSVVRFAGTGALTADTPTAVSLKGAAPVAFAYSAKVTVTPAVALVGKASVVVATAANVSVGAAPAAVALKGSASVTVVTTANVSVAAIPAAVSLNGAASVAVSAYANVSVEGTPSTVVLRGTAPVAVASAAVITVGAAPGTVALSGAAGVGFSSSADISVAAIPDAVMLAGAAAIVFSSIAETTLGGVADVALAGRTSIVFKSLARIDVDNSGQVIPLIGVTSGLRVVYILDDVVGRIRTFGKQPSEMLDYCFDFSPWLSDCEDTIATARVVCDGTMSIVEIVPGPETVVFLTSGGQDGETNKVTCTVNTVGGRVKEAELKVGVLEAG